MSTLYNINALDEDNKGDIQNDYAANIKGHQYVSNIDVFTACGIYINVIKKVAKKIKDAVPLATSIRKLYQHKDSAPKVFSDDDKKDVESFAVLSNMLSSIISDLQTSLREIALIGDNEVNLMHRQIEGVAHFKNLSEMFFLTYNFKYALQAYQVAEKVCEEFESLIAIYKKSE